MASTSALKKNMKVNIKTGTYAGHTATVLDPVVRPNDDLINRRKVLVQIDGIFVGEGEEERPFETYILPRLLDVDTEPTIPTEATVPTNVITQEQFVQPAVPTVPVVAPTTTNVHLPTPQRITDPMDPALDRFRPDPEVLSRYISRTVPGGMSDIDFLLGLREQRDEEGFSPNVALVGETQSGKTMLVECLAVVAAERDGLPKPYPIFTLSGSGGITNYDIYGQTSAVIIDGQEVLVWMEGMAPIAALCGFLYLDEWNAVAPSQAVGVHPLLDHRRAFVNYQKAVPDGHGGFAPEVVKANPEYFWCLATINPDYKGTQQMAEATTNRFRWLPWDYDDETEAKLIPSKTVLAFGALLREAYHIRALTIPIGTSALERLNHDCATFGVDAALWSFKGMFPPKERPRVQGFIEEKGIDTALKAEYPVPTFNPEAEKEEVHA
jgi:hypothetical protein